MKTKLLMLILILFTINSMFALYVQVGNGQSATSYMPVYANYDYGWSNYIISSDQIGEAITIDQIKFDVTNEPASFTMTDQSIFFKLTSEEDASLPYPNPAANDFTLVYTGSVTWSGSGWQGVELTTPFEYDGTSNLQVVWENRWTEITSDYPQFRKTESEYLLGSFRFAEDIFDEADGGPANFIPNTRLFYTVEDAPEYPVVVSPANGDLNVDVNDELTWTVGENTTDVSLYLSSDLEAVFNETSSALVVDHQNVTSFSGTLGGLTTYYWKVVAYNSENSSSALSEICHFTTGDGPIALPYTQDFEIATVPALPTGWTSIVESDSQIANVKTTSSSAYEGNQSLFLGNGDDEDPTLIAITPAFENEGNSINFYAKGSTAGMRVSVGYITDIADASTYIELDLIDLESVYAPYSVSLEDSRTVRNVAFKHPLGETWTIIYIDNVSIADAPIVYDEPVGLTQTIEENNVTLNWFDPSYEPQGTFESFEGIFAPAGWETVVTNISSSWAQYGTLTFDSGIVAPTDGVSQAGVAFANGAQDEWLISPVISDPTSLTFDFYGHYGSTHDDNYYVKVSTDGGNEWDAVWNASDLPENDNYYDAPVTIDLSAYSSQDVQIAWHFVDGDGTGLWYTTFIDNVVILDGQREVSLKSSDFYSYSRSNNSMATTPTSLKRDKNEPTMRNRYVRSLSGYNIYRDETLISSVANDVLTYTDTELGNGTYQYYVTAVYDDANESDPSNIVIANLYYTPDGVYLFSDDFEEYELFNAPSGSWITHDLDQSVTYGTDGFDFLGQATPMSYIVFDASATVPPAQGMDAHSGTNLLSVWGADVTAGTATENNDWLISSLFTLVDEGAVSFWARSFTVQYGAERFNVLVSDGSTNPEDFTVISGDNYVEADENWNQYSYDLDAYANQSIRVAIQCVSSDAFVFFVDDFAVTAPEGTPNNEDITPVTVTSLNSNYPNPFNPETTISYDMKSGGNVAIEVYNILGQKVKTLVNETKTAGNHTVVWNGSNDNNDKVASGIYFYKMKTDSYSKTYKMILMK